MLSLILSILGIIFTILFVVGTHEAAHFGMARALGVKVLCFSIGFGKRLFSWHDRKGTEYIIALIPLGGYVRMLDESEGQVPEAEKKFAFNRQPYYKKFLIVAAGPLCNLLCAFLLYWLIFIIGFKTIAPVIGTITPNSIAAQSGLQGNEEIISVDNSPTSSWLSIMFRLLSHTGNRDTLTLEVKKLGTEQKQIHTLDLTHWNLDALSPDPLGSLGIKAYEPPLPLIIDMMAPDSPATASPLQMKDKILAINHKAVTNWLDVVTFIAEHPNQRVIFEVQRGTNKISFPVKIGSKGLFTKTGYLGVGPKFEWPPNLVREVRYGFVEAIPHAWQQLYDFSYLNLLLFGKLITGKLSVQSLGGPITIFESAGSALNYGFLSFLSFLAFLSISIGIINIFPIPGLDGGHLALQTIEAIIQRPLPEKILDLLYRCGLFILLTFISIALVNDIMRLW